MSLARPDAAGPLRRERLRTARLYFVCEAAPRGEDPEPLLRAALTGGVDIVQLRDKEATRRTLEIAGQTFCRLCDTYSALFIVNDDPSLARACDADGVHVGQDDVASPRRARSSAPTRSSASRPTPSSRSPTPRGSTTSASARSGRRRPRRAVPAVGLELVRFAAENSRLPFYAIGGIDPTEGAGGR